MTEKLDPYDVGALEKSLNDSATRVSTIWISFLIFSLYLLTAAATVEHRQLFLAEPVKLPVLNIDLPLWGFFFLAPILFVILHAYVLMQVLLLARTAAAYNAAVERAGLPPEENATLRQRLANTLFAQIFAGSPRERGGWLGWLLKAMAGITLAIAPILILLVFQFMFLPYHSHIATWTHRALIAVELAAIFLFWPLVLDARRDFEWPTIWEQFKHAFALPRRLFGPGDRRTDEWIWLRQKAVPLASCVLFVLISLTLATFPGEPHVNLLTGQSWSSVQCTRWFSRSQRDDFLGRLETIGIDKHWQNDRLLLPRVDVVDDEKLTKIEKATSDRKLPDFKGERTRILRDRELNCSDLSNADLRRVDLTGARLSQAILYETALQGASLDRAQLQGASLYSAQLQGASLADAQLQGAFLANAQLQGASLDRAQLQGALLSGPIQGLVVGAQLQGASLNNAELQGAILGIAELQAASLVGAELQGALIRGPQFSGFFVNGPKFQGALLDRAQLQGASLGGAELESASFYDAQLQGASLEGVQTEIFWRTLLSPFVLRAKSRNLLRARSQEFHREN